MIGNSDNGMQDGIFRKNLLINAFQQLVTYILPFVTVPYLTRVIGANGIGIYSYTNSIVHYFILIGTIGLTLYGTRQIAYVRDNEKELEEEFWKVFFLRLFFSSFSLVIYFLFVRLTTSEYKDYMLIQSLALIGSAIDTSWYYQGIESFNKLAKRIVSFKLIGAACIFIFIKSVEDVWLYVLIQVLIILVGNVFLLVNLFSSIKFRRITIQDIFSHLKPALALFLPQIAIEIYAVFDKTMLGVLADVSQVGLYTKAEEFAKVPLMLISVLSTVLFPRLSNQFKKDGISALKQSLNNNLQTVTIVGIGASFGIAGIAREFVKWMMGDGFIGSIPMLLVLSPLTLIIGTSNMIGRQYLLPANKNNVFTVTVSLGAFINFFLNIIMIPICGGVGACIATICAEFCVMISQFIYVRKAIDIKSYFGELFKCLLSGILMYIVVRLIGMIVNIKVINTLVQILFGVIIYFGVLFLLKDKTVKSLLGFACLIKK